MKNQILDPNSKYKHHTLNPVELSFIKCDHQEYEVFQINSSYGINGVFVMGYIVEIKGKFVTYWANDIRAYQKDFDTVYDALEALEYGFTYNKQPCLPKLLVSEFDKRYGKKD